MPRPGPQASEQTGTFVPSDAELARSLPGGFSSRYATANGVRLHYVIGGRGEPLVLLHGWPQTWWTYHKVMPALASRFRVVAVDLRGGGGSEKPQSGYDKRTLAKDIRELVRVLAVPGQPFFPWWFAFNQITDLPQKLVPGRSRLLTDWMFDYLLRNPGAIDNRDRAIYADRYSTADAIRGGNGWYQTFVQDIDHGKTYGLVTAPMLGMAHDLFYPDMAARLPAQGTDVRLLQVADTGHYFVEEQPQAVIDAFTSFFA